MNLHDLIGSGWIVVVSLEDLDLQTMADGAFLNAAWLDLFYRSGMEVAWC